MQDESLDDLYRSHVQEIKRRHDHALEKADAEAVVISAGQPRYYFRDDRAAPYVVNPDFNVWLPLTDVPGSHIVYRPGERPLLAYCHARDYWHASPAPPDGFWTEYFDIRFVEDSESARRMLPDDLSRYVFLGEVTEPRQSLGIEQKNPARLTNLLAYARATKTSYELACMRRASRRAVSGHLAAAAAFAAGASEFDIHLDYCRAAGQTDEDLPYHSIVATNENAAVLHYQYRRRSTRARSHSFLIDAGASFNGYAADITRSYAGQPGRFAELIEYMDELQLGICDELRAGIDFVALHRETHLHLGGLLLSTGIASAGSAEALVAAGITRAFLPHGLGHLLGLQVHDVGGRMGKEDGTEIQPPSEYPHLRLTRTLETDQVLTIEPGIYFIDMLLEPLRESDAGRLVNWGLVDELSPCGGIRIEDNVRVLPEGSENLTREAFAGEQAADSIA